MKKVLLLSIFVLSVQTNAQLWKKLNAGTVESGLPGNPTIRYGIATGFGDDVIGICDESIVRHNNNGSGTYSVLTVLPTGGGLSSKVNGIKKCPDGLFYVWGFFPVTGTEYYGLMVSNSSNPTSFSVVPSSLMTLQFATHVAQRGITSFTDYQYGSQTGFMIYGPDLISFNNTTVPSTVLFMTGAGLVADLPVFKPNTEPRNGPLFPVTNPNIRYLKIRVNGNSTNGHLLIGGAFRELGGNLYHGLASFNNGNGILTDLNVTQTAGNQAVTHYDSYLGKEQLSWKDNNLPTYLGIVSPGNLEINNSNVVVGVSGGAPNLQGNSLCNFDGKLFVGGSRSNSTQPANTYTYAGGVYTDASGSGANNLDANGQETLYYLFATPNFIYATGNFQTSLGDVSNYIAVQSKVFVSLPLLFKSLNAQLSQNGSAQITFAMFKDIDVQIEQSTNGVNFSQVGSVFALRDQLVSNTFPMVGSIMYFRLKSSGVYSGIVNVRKAQVMTVKKSGYGVDITVPFKSSYVISDVSGRILKSGLIQNGSNFVPVNDFVQIIFVTISDGTKKQTFPIFNH
jgi:hypothetical protein